MKNRGISNPPAAPRTGLRTSGIGDLKSPRTDHTPTISKAQGNPIPRPDQPAITAMEAAAVNGEDAGANGQDAGAAPSNGALGKYRDTLVPPPGFHVP
jgi:hypothetical protein